MMRPSWSGLIFIMGIPTMDTLILNQPPDGWHNQMANSPIYWLVNRYQTVKFATSRAARIVGCSLLLEQHVQPVTDRVWRHPWCVRLCRRLLPHWKRMQWVFSPGDSLMIIVHYLCIEQRKSLICISTWAYISFIDFKWKRHYLCLPGM